MDRESDRAYIIAPSNRKCKQKMIAPGVCPTPETIPKQEAKYEKRECAMFKQLYDSTSPLKMQAKKTPFPGVKWEKDPETTLTVPIEKRSKSPGRYFPLEDINQRLQYTTVETGMQDIFYCRPRKARQNPKAAMQ